MSALFNLESRIALGVVGSIASVCLACSPRIHTLADRSFDRLLFTVFAASRILFFVLVYLVLKLPPHADVPAFYFPQAQSVLAGLVPYLDFPSSYGPLHGYLDAAVISLWRSPLAIILLAVVVECSILPLWFKSARPLLPERELRIAAALYFASPISLEFVATSGQNGYLVAVLTALAFFLLTRSRHAASGAASALGLVVVKFTAILYAPFFFLASAKRTRWTLGFVATLLAGYAYFIFRHAQILQPLQIEGVMRTSGSWPYLIEAVLGIHLSNAVWDAGLIAALGAVTLYFAWVTAKKDRADILRALVYSLTAVTLAMLAFSKKSSAPYLVQALFPICLLVAKGGRARIVACGVFMAVATAEPSYWFMVVEQALPAELHQGLLHLQPAMLGFFALEVLEVCGYTWLLWLALRAFGRPSSPARAERGVPEAAVGV